MLCVLCITPVLYLNLQFELSKPIQSFQDFYQIIVPLPIQVFYPQSGSNHNSTGHVLVASYTWGKDADRYNGMNRDDIIKECLQVQI